MARRRAQPKYIPTRQPAEPEIGVWRHDYSRTEPRTWELLLGRRNSSIRITVTRHIHHEPDDWVLIAEPWYSGQALQAKEIDSAKREALELVLHRMKVEVDILEGVILYGNR